MAAGPDEVATKTPIKHFVVLMQAGHSFDNYFGTFPGADGIPADVCQRLDVNRASAHNCVKPFHLDESTPPENLARGLKVLSRQYNGGKMDGFVSAYRRIGQDGTTAMGYYDESDLPYTWGVAREFVLFDRFFSSGPGPASRSYLDWIDGAPANRAAAAVQPNIFDRLGAKGVSATIYVEGLTPRAAGTTADTGQALKVPLLGAARYQAPGSPLRIVDLSQYYRDLQQGTLPAVSYIVSSTSSENPPGRPAVGQAFLRQLTSGLVRSRYWNSSAFMWTYDSYGGWYDHVPPPFVGDQQLGLRVPALLMSPYAKVGRVDHTQLDYTSIPKFVEDNWSLEPLSARVTSSPGLMSAFDFGAPARPAVLLPSSAAALPPLVLSAADNRRASRVIYTLYGGAAALVACALVGVVGARRLGYRTGGVR
jgi:phospholipase C